MFGSPTRTRTRDQLINSQSLYQLSYRGIVPHLTDAGRDFGPAANTCQATSARFMRSTASCSVSREQAKDIRR